MTVKELIEALKKYPEDHEVVLEEALASLRNIVSIDEDDTHKPHLIILS